MADQGMKTLFLLHGYTGDAWNWVPEYLAEKYNFAIVIPSGENGFWIDGLSTGHKYGTFLGVELVDYVRKTFGLAKSKEDTFIMGFSMGGYGALRTALKYPDVFGKTAAWSSALIVHEVATMKPGYDNGMSNYDYYRECFGEPSKVLESELFGCEEGYTDGAVAMRRGRVEKANGGTLFLDEVIEDILELCERNVLEKL